MSQITTDKVAGVSTLQQGSQLIDPGIITAMSLREVFIFNEVTLFYWTIMLSRGPEVEDGVFDTLAAGYARSVYPLSWHGFLEIPPQTWMIIQGWGRGAQQGTGIESRITLTRDGSFTDILIKLQGKKTV